jgi:hypothetical protein
MQAFALLFDAFVIAFVVATVRYLRRRPAPLENWRPSDDDARSGRRVTLFMRPKTSTARGLASSGGDGWVPVQGLKVTSAPNVRGNPPVAGSSEGRS